MKMELSNMVYVGEIKPISEKTIDWSKVDHGDNFTAVVDGSKCKGQIAKDILGIVKLCYQCGDTIYFVPTNTIGRITNLKITKSKPMAKKTQSTEDVVRRFKTSNGSKWEIVKTTTGKSVQYFCRLRSRNSNILSVGTGLNTVQSAIKNIKAVMNSCKVVEPTVGKIKK